MLCYLVAMKTDFIFSAVTDMLNTCADWEKMHFLCCIVGEKKATFCAEFWEKKSLPAVHSGRKLHVLETMYQMTF